MKHPRLLTTLALLATTLPALAQLNIPPANGSAGAFSPVANVEIDLSQVIAGDAITASNPSQNVGIYDFTRWVVVYKYSSVNIPAGVTVTFKNHPSYAPVVWLVQESVNIAGTVNLDGKNGAVGSGALTPTEPGPGGFRGGALGPSGAGLGLGPGGDYATYNTSYGNPQILPLIGGSGGRSGSGYSGGGAGGAMLIAAPGTIQISGSALARGSFGNSGDGNTYASGGAIKLIANQVTGTGTLNAATTGRVRIETITLAATITTTPSTIAVAPGTTPTLFQSPSSPTVKIISVTYKMSPTSPDIVVPAPADPTAPLVSSADLGIESNLPATITLRTENFATAGAIVAVRIANKYGSATTLNATLQSGGTTTLSTWTLSTTLAPGFVTLQARATQN